MEIVQTNVAEEDGLLFACVLDGEGGGRLLDWDGVAGWSIEQGPMWVHLDRNSARVQNWLHGSSGLTEPTVGALLADETRPRVFHGNKGVIAILRGVNSNEGADPEDMVAMRIWSDGKRVITLRHRRLMTPRDILSELVDLGEGATTTGQLFERLITRLIQRIADLVDSFDEKLDELETHIDIGHAVETRRALSEIRQDAVVVRRYMAPQRDALHALVADPPQWLDDHSRMVLRETTDRLVRYVEELDSVRERSLVIKDDISNQLAESTNKTLYVLSIISAIFLPLGFLTGLLGINVGGMPGVESGWGFWISAGLMAVVLAIELVILRWLKWI